MLNNRELVRVEGKGYFYYKGEKDDMIFIRTIDKTGKISYESFLVDGENLEKEIEEIANKCGENIKSKALVSIETFKTNRDKDTYRLCCFEGEEAVGEPIIRVVNRPQKLRVAGNGRCYTDIYGNIYIFTKLIGVNRSWLEYIKLDDKVVKYSLDGYLNALQRNNAETRNVRRVEFITDKEFFDSELQKRKFNVKG